MLESTRAAREPASMPSLHRPRPHSAETVAALGTSPACPAPCVGTLVRAPSIEPCSASAWRTRLASTVKRETLAATAFRRSLAKLASTALQSTKAAEGSAASGTMLAGNRGWRNARARWFATIPPGGNPSGSACSPWLTGTARTRRMNRTQTRAPKTPVHSVVTSRPSSRQGVEDSNAGIVPKQSAKTELAPSGATLTCRYGPRRVLHRKWRFGAI